MTHPKVIELEKKKFAIEYEQDGYIAQQSMIDKLQTIKEMDVEFQGPKKVEIMNEFEQDKQRAVEKLRYKVKKLEDG